MNIMKSATNDKQNEPSEQTIKFDIDIDELSLISAKTPIFER